jgi:hypothetical protein
MAEESPVVGFQPAKETRDLSFLPVVNPNPQRLTAEHIDFYNRQGYIKPLSIFDAAGAARNRAYFDRLLDMLRAMKDGRDGNYAINGYHICCEGLWEIATHPVILDYVEDLIGPNIIAWASHFFCKQPHDSKHVPWHQDASYWPLTPARTVTVWLAIDDADLENSAMLFLPGTHRQGPLAWEQTQKPAVLHQEIVNVAQYGQPVADELKAGQMSLHADMLAHGSTPNTSDRRRCGLTVRYCPPTVRALDENWMRQAILCRGTDSTGNWLHHPRPHGDTLTPDKKPKSIGGN